MNWRRLAVLGSLAVMIIFAVVVSLTIFSQASLRLDEAQSLFQTSRDLGGMYNLVAQDVHVPLYHTLLHFWILLFGQDIFTARLLSLVFLVGTIIATYWLAAKAFGRRSIGLFAALLVTLSPFMNWYGSEARMYTLLAFMTVLHLIFTLKLMRSGTGPQWVGWVITAILGVYSHYFFVFVLVSEFVTVLMVRKRFANRHIIRNIIIAGSLIAASLVPWITYVFTQGFARNTQPSLAEPSAGDLFDTYAQFIFGFQPAGINTIILSLWPIAVLLAFFALQKSNRKIPPETTLFIMVATIPILAAFLFSITVRPFYLSRYLIVSLPALLIFIAWLLSRYRHGVATAIRIGLVALMAALLVLQAMNPNTPVKEDYRETVRYLEEGAGVSDVIILSAPFTVYPVEYYYSGPAKLTTQPIWDRFSSGSVPAFDDATVEEETRRNVADYRRAWLVLSYDQGYNEKLKKYYDDHYQKLSEKTFSPGLSVYEYQIRYDAPVTIE